MEPLKGKAAETSGSGTVSTKLQRIVELAKQTPQMAFTTLAHHMDIDWLREAYQRTRKDGVVGVDGQTADEYRVNLEENLRSLLERANSGAYQAPPLRRVHIPKKLCKPGLLVAAVGWIIPGHRRARRGGGPKMLMAS